MRPDIDKVRPDIDKVRPDIDQMKPDIDQMKPDIDQMKPDIDQMKPDIDEVRPDIGDVRPSLRRGGRPAPRENAGFLATCRPGWARLGTLQGVPRPFRRTPEARLARVLLKVQGGAP